MFTPTHRHADGGLYQCLGSQKGKGEDPGVGWVDGVAYRDADNLLFWTSKVRWDDRFEEVEPVATQDLIIWDDSDNSNVAAYRFKLIEASDVYHMIISCGPPSKHTISREFIDWMKRVMKAQADMIASKLHIRDRDFPDLIGDVNAFHAKFGQEYTGKPRLLPRDLHDFRVKFHEEETTEYSDEYSLLCAGIVNEDRREILHRLEKQLDALADACWVILGTADLQFGRKIFYEAWNRVVKANMAKVRKLDTTDGDGSVDSGRAPKYDIVKPAGWLPPDHSDLIEDNSIFDDLFNKEEPTDLEYNGTAQGA